MSKRFERVDYSKMSLAEIVERKAKTNAPFPELPQADRQKILRFLRLNGINKKAFGQKWFDVLSGKFYVEEYVVVDDPEDIDQKKKSFDSFGEYYEYTNGDIYENACYYGRRFTEKEISAYSLDLKRMNFDSFEQETISSAERQSKPELKHDALSRKADPNTKASADEGGSAIRIIKKYDGRFFCVRKMWVDGCGNVLGLVKRFFTHFFDFAHFLEGDLSGANLLLCDGIENLASVQGLKLDGAKVRSVAAEALGLPLNPPSEESLKTNSFKESERNELETKEGFLLVRPDDEEYSIDIGYVSDIHLQHRFAAYGCKTAEDVHYVVHVVAEAIAHHHGRGFGFNLIGGDISSDFATFKRFIAALYKEANYQKYFFVLGNHELWSFPGRPFGEIVKTYRSTLEELGGGMMRLVQNNLFYHADFSWKEICENELSSIDEPELRAKTRGADMIVFGGLGFAGTNEKFNANSGIYLSTVNREQEIELSARFLKLYQKVASALRGRQVIVLTHMPMSDWGGEDLKPEDGFIYVNGHCHRNLFFDDGKTRVFADNQIGYKGKAVSMKKIPVDFGFDWFADYPDGIHEITKDDYYEYYRGIGEHITFTRGFEKLYLLKRDSAYMFLLLDLKGRLKLLSGGMPKNVGDHDLNYFYERMANYAKSVRLYLAKYEAFQKQVSSEVRKIGGYGDIHGAIVDIDFFNHLYLNCFDGSIVPYSASSMIDKYVYKNLGSLLHYERPELYKKYVELASKDGGKGALVIRNESLPITNKTARVTDTGMYRISRVLKSLQFTTKYNLIRIWSDALADRPSEENGKQIVAALLELTK